MNKFLHTTLQRLPGILPRHVHALAQHLGILTYDHLLHHFPLRYEDRVRCYTVSELRPAMDHVQVAGQLGPLLEESHAKGKMLKGTLTHGQETLSLVWFHKWEHLKKSLTPGRHYLAFGKPRHHGGRWSMVHPELYHPSAHAPSQGTLQPVYPTTERLMRAGVTNLVFKKLQRTLLALLHNALAESLPSALMAKYRLMGRAEALATLHFPPDHATLHQASRRLKFEELLFFQLHLIGQRHRDRLHCHAQPFTDTEMLHDFGKAHLPFALTAAQHRTLQEIAHDMGKPQQMNRLLQGDVGSGKTVVAFMAMLLPWAHGSQVAFMAPTEVLAVQHYRTLKKWASIVGKQVHLLTGRTAPPLRRRTLRATKEGQVDLLVGTHALLQEDVGFANLGLAVIDEQHRFGVMQRGHFYAPHTFPGGGAGYLPHILVMSATPIPRTLALTRYADLSLSLLDELPAGRRRVRTLHRHDQHRLALLGFVKKQLDHGHQVYFVYPRIEEATSPHAAYKDLMDGYHSIYRAFPGVPVGILHGRMRPDAKIAEMEKFATGKTKILVATTVVEVGIDVPNATLMVIENAERYGLSQLHQLRGRIGRGEAASFCVLMTPKKLSPPAKKRIEILLSTQDGFRVAEADMRQRGYGNLMGLAQSGLPPLRTANLPADEAILSEANKVALALLDEDPHLALPDHQPLLRHLTYLLTSHRAWGTVG